MASNIAVPVQEYLQTAYEPDCEYIDGEVIERHVGEYPHSRLQGLLYAYFLRRYVATKAGQSNLTDRIFKIERLGIQVPLEKLKVRNPTS